VNINQKHGLIGWTALHYAGEKGDAACIKLLLERGQCAILTRTLNALSTRGYSPMQFCPVFRAGADRSIKNTDGRTALDLARKLAKLEAAALLAAPSAAAATSSGSAAGACFTCRWF
jgi:ankyrin repeat protein